MTNKYKQFPIKANRYFKKKAFSENKIFLFTCIYNDRRHVSKLLDSIIEQDTDKFVYYFYDDGSKENYDDIITVFQDKMKVKGVPFYFEKGKENIGINKATEHCLIKMRDKFEECTHFAWINSDDWLHPYYISILTKVIQKNPDAGVIVPNIYSVRELENGKLSSPRIKYNKKKFRKYKEYQFSFFYMGSGIYSHFLVNKKKFLCANPNCTIYDNSIIKRMWNDMCVLFLMSIFNFKFININKPLSYFLLRQNSLHQTQANEPRPYLKEYFEYLNCVNPNYIPIYQKTLDVIFTSTRIRELVLLKKFKEAKTYYKIMKLQSKELKLPKYYLFPNKTSYLLIHFPRQFLLLRKIKYFLLQQR
jgi:glycosyltransferase involved in cell wall biosynthesis